MMRIYGNEQINLPSSQASTANYAVRPARNDMISYENGLFFYSF